MTWLLSLLLSLLHVRAESVTRAQARSVSIRTAASHFGVLAAVSAFLSVAAAVVVLFVILVHVVVQSKVLDFLLVAFQRGLAVGVASPTASLIALVACRGANVGHRHFDEPAKVGMLGKQQQQQQNIIFAQAWKKKKEELSARRKHYDHNHTS